MIDGAVAAAAAAWTQSDKMTFWIIWVPFGLPSQAENRQLLFFCFTHCSDEVPKVFVKTGIDGDDQSIAAARRYQYEECRDIIEEFCSF